MSSRFPLIVSAILVLLSAGSLMMMTINSHTMEKLALAQEEPESEQVQAFTAELSGNQELPPVNTIGTGLLNLTGNNQSLAYSLALSNMTNTTSAHINMGAANENGKVIVTLYRSESPSGIEIESLAGNITADKLQGPLSGATLDELIGTVNNGTAYVNVHSADFPNGEIRGMLSLQDGEEEEEEEEE
jgi:ribosomal protein L12E/L44/L45/RPP1/RPP2